MRLGLQHVRRTPSNRSARVKENDMGDLDPNWLSVDLALVDSEIEAWSAGLKESYDSLHADQEDGSKRVIEEPSPLSQS